MATNDDWMTDRRRRMPAASSAVRANVFSGGFFLYFSMI
jgi:hypothetical protein